MRSDFETLSTQRLFLRKLNPETYNQLFRNSTDDELMAFFGFTTVAELLEEKNRFHKGVEMSGKSFLYFHLVEKESGTVMGWCGFHTWYTQHQRAELGYVLNSDQYKRMGYMKEAMHQVLNYGFDIMKLHRIEAFVSPLNVPSLKLMNHFGFIREGLLREHYFKNNNMEDSLVFSILVHEFRGAGV